MAVFLSPSALVLAAEWAQHPEDAVTGLGYGLSLSWIAVAAIGALATAVLRLRRQQVWDDRQAAVVYGRAQAAARAAAEAAPGGMPDWARWDVDTSSRVLGPQAAYTPADAWGNVEQIFRQSGVEPRDVRIHAVGHAPVPPAAQDSWEHLDDIRADLAGLFPTQMLPTVGDPGQPVRLR